RDAPPIRMPVSAGTLDGFRAWWHSAAYPPHVGLSYLDTVICIEDNPTDAGIMVPASATTLEGFRAWAQSDAFPDRGRISFLDQEIYFDMSPEEMETHNKVKEVVNRTAGGLNEELDLGEFYTDGVLLTHPNGL